MSNRKRATILLDSGLHRALRAKSLVAGKSISALVNDAVRLSFAEDAEDLAVFSARANEPGLDLEKVLAAMGLRAKKKVPVT